MHSLFISVLALMIVLGSAIGLHSSRSAEIFTLAILVALIGVPHGALDHWVGQRLFRPAFGRFWGVAFFSIYLTVALFTVVGWFVLPATTILVFFLISAWHFGMEERYMVEGGWVRHVLAIASGGMIIWMPALCRGDDVVKLLITIAPIDHVPAITFCVGIVAAAAGILAPLSVFDCIRQDLQFVRKEREWFNFIFESNCFRMLSFALLCFIAHPLVSFTVYFCGWHSVRGLHHLTESLGESVFDVYRKLLPLTFVALGLVVVGALVWSTSATIEASLIRTVFIGLSGLAVPHLCLHAAAGVLKQRFTNPSSAMG